VLDELHCPFVVHVVKEPSNVQVQHPFTRLRVNPTISASNASCWLRPVGVLPSPLRRRVGAADPPLFGWFIGTTTQSDPSTPWRQTWRLNAFSGRPAVLLSGDAEVSRFSCIEVS